MSVRHRDNWARRILWLVLPFAAVFALLRFLPPVAFWIAGAFIVVACGVSAGLQTRREIKR